MVEKANGEREKIMAGQLAYFSKGQQHRRLNYSRVTAMKRERLAVVRFVCLIRQVVNLRLKGTGKFWLLNHAEMMLHTRCQWAAGAWGNFCASILTAMLYPA